MERNPLADLVMSHCDRTGDTLSAIAARGGMSRQTLSALVHKGGPKSFPRASTLRALARGLDLPYETVRQLATARAYGEGEGDNPRRLVVLLTAQLDALTDRDLEVVLATTRALKRHPVA